MPNPEWHDENGKFAGRPGPGRPKGIPNFETAMRRVLANGADRFAEVFDQLLMAGDSKAWELAAKRAYPEPKQEIGISQGDGEPIQFGWKDTPSESSEGEK